MNSPAQTAPDSSSVNGIGVLALSLDFLGLTSLVLGFAHIQWIRERFGRDGWPGSVSAF